VRAIHPSRGRTLPEDKLSLALQEVRRFDEAITANQDGATIYRDTGRPRRGSGDRGPRPRVARGAAVREAMTAYQDAIAIYGQIGDRYREGIALEHLERAQTAEPT
jgi:hypothetical protein